MRKQHPERPSGFYAFSIDLSCYGYSLSQKLKDAQVINIHMAIDFLDFSFVLPRIPSNSLVVWTLHDVNSATGGCIHPMDCMKFENSCGSCPQLGSNAEQDLSREIWMRKKRAFDMLRARSVVVSPSHWLANLAKKSSLLGSFPVHVIPNSINPETYKPHSQSQAREQLGLSQESPVLLFVASNLSNPLKGVEFLIDSIPLILQRFPDLQVVAVGESNGLDATLSNFRFLGKVRDQAKMALIYSTADVFVTPSLADNLPNVLLEAASCGLPAVGFPIGGIPEIIQNGVTGIVAEKTTTQALAQSIIELLSRVLKDRDRWRTQCRALALSKYFPEFQANSYLDLYKKYW